MGKKSLLPGIFCVQLNWTCLCGLMLTIVLTCSTLFSRVEADRFSGLCPPGYPRLVTVNGTGRCFPVGSKGPCPKLSVVASDPRSPNFGICQCKNLGSSCFGRPLLEWEDRCYFEFSQGPCRKGQWLVRGTESGRQGASCQKNPCPMVENQRSLLRAEIPRKDFYFTIDNSYECFLTGTQAFCEDGYRAYFLGSERLARCLNYEPWDCDYYTPLEQSVTLRQGDPNKSRPSPGFGVPYDGI